MKERIANVIGESLNIGRVEVLSLLEIPKDSKLGDYAFPCFSIAKKQNKNPLEIAKKAAKDLGNNLEFEKVEAVGGYVNIFLNRFALVEKTLDEIQTQKDNYGASKAGSGKTIVFDISSPNIAKPFGIGHLRSTIIGNALANISKFNGFRTIKINYLGDWGTQFGKLIVGFKKFGSSEKLKQNPISHLLELYVRVNEDETLEEPSRAAFKMLENGEKEYAKLWELFRKLSIKEFGKIYGALGIEFDVTEGESKYASFKDEIKKSLKEKKLLEISDNAFIVNLEKYGLDICLIEKTDGASLYTTRDLAAAIERQKKYKFEKMIYEAGSEQKLHFSQIFKILEILGYDWAKNCVHVEHGLYLGSDGKKFSTRKGKTIFMEDILSETQELARAEIEKREKLPKKELDERAGIIANAAIFYGDLKNYRANNIVFDINRFLSFEGDTGPYLLYTYARARSILRKAKFSAKKKYKIGGLSDSEKNLAFQLSKFQQVIEDSYRTLSPNLVANYAFQIAQSFNEFYHSNPVIGSPNEQFLLVLVDSFSQVLKNALRLLGIKTIEKM
jgi:arginyl-tRNA synthetase